MNRRDFLSWVGVGSLAASLPVAFAACSSDPEQTADAPEGEAAAPEDDTAAESDETAASADGFQVVGKVADLESAGFIADKGFAGGPLIVIASPDDPATLLAYNATCNHQQCSVDWSADQTLFVCPCHDSQFGVDGSLTKGPATAPLTAFEVKVEGDDILVKAG